MTRELVLALDIGGSKIAAGLVDAGYRPVLHQVAPSMAKEGAAAVLAAARELGSRLLEAAPEGADVIGCGFSSAGVIDAEAGRVLDATPAIPGWPGTDLAGFARDAFNLPACAANDAHCALIGELAGECHAGTVIMLTLGTGVGGAIMHDGKLLTGHRGHAGHFGRARLSAGSPDGDSLDHRISGTALVQAYAKASGELVQGATIFQRAIAGDLTAIRVCDQWRGELAAALMNIHWVLDPARVILGGGVIDSASCWWGALESDLGQAGVSMALEPARLGNQAGMLGAAREAWRRVAGHAGETGSA